MGRGRRGTRGARGGPGRQLWVERNGRHALLWRCLLRPFALYTPRARVLPQGGLLDHRRLRLSRRCHSRPPGALFLLGLLSGLGSQLPPAKRPGRRPSPMAHARPWRIGDQLRRGWSRRALHYELRRTGIPDRPAVAEELETLAARLPPAVRFGASSWNYPGWGGLVYHREYSGRGAPSRMLEEYSRFPLFRTVGIDSSFYAPPTEETLGAYAEH